jgi:serine/threonine protein kinase
MLRTLLAACKKVQSELRLQHRDLKPSNILRIGSEWYIADFGIAKIIEAGGENFLNNSSNLQIEETLVGTFPYMSPHLRKRY